jgi:hypothetical protein
MWSLIHIDLKAEVKPGTFEYLTQGIQALPNPIHNANLSTSFPFVSIMTFETGRKHLLKRQSLFSEHAGQSLAGMSAAAVNLHRTASGLHR